MQGRSGRTRDRGARCWVFSFAPLLALFGLLASMAPVVAGELVADDSGYQNEEAVLVGTLSLDDEAEDLFWSGGAVNKSKGADVLGVPRPDPSKCGTDYDCFSYLIDVAGHVPSGARLRVGASLFDSWIENTNGQSTEGGHDGYDLIVLRRDDLGAREVARSNWVTGIDVADVGKLAQFPGLDQEAVVADPEPGTYEIKVIAHAVCDERADGSRDCVEDGQANARFSMRAKLEKPFILRGQPKLRLPDLRPQPAWNLEFFCRDEEFDEEHPLEHFCLRFAFGYENAGAGPLDLRFQVPEEGVTQYVFREDGTPEDYDDNLMSGAFETFDAGDYEFHEHHGHYHYAGMYQHELLWVEAPGELRSRRFSPKLGNCGHDWFMADFDRFGQDPTSRHDSEGCTGGSQGTNLEVRIGLSTGWGDYYGKNTIDNYVRFTDPDDAEVLPLGEYVLRSTVNQDQTITEERFGNNVGYTHFRVTDQDVIDGKTLDEEFEPVLCLFERGRGSSPWDPEKEVLPVHSRCS